MNIKIALTLLSVSMTNPTPLFVKIDHLMPSQDRYSEKNLQLKLSRVDQSNPLKFDVGKSVFGLSAAIPVVTLADQPNLYVLCDGHHDALVAISVGAKTMPVKVVDRYPGSLDKKFWTWAQQKGYAYLSKQLDSSNKLAWQDLQDFPARYFMAISARKIASANTDVKNSMGATYPLWLKIHKGRRPFIEFIVADVLVKNGFVYNYGDEDDAEKFQQLIEQARKILLKNKVEGFDLLPTKEHYLESKFIKEILAAEKYKGFS